MSSTVSQISYEPQSFDHAVIDMKRDVEFAKAVGTKASGDMVRSAKDFAASSQASLSAFVQAGQILATGSQDLFRLSAEASRSALTETLSGIRAMAGAKTFKERMDLQASLFHAAATRAASENNRFALASIDLAERASAPLKAHAVAAAAAMATSKV